MSHHYYATCAIGWATADTREEAIEKLVAANRSHFKTVTLNCQKAGEPGAYIWSCKVHAPSDAKYRIEWYAPVGLKTSEAQEHATTYITAKQIAFTRTYKGEADALRERLEDSQQEQAA